jgi:DNA-binding transcriptional ArsR family regulator
MSEQLRSELAQHLRRVEAAIASESRGDDGSKYYRLSLLARERARIKRHLQRLAEDREEPAS